MRNGDYLGQRLREADCASQQAVEQSASSRDERLPARRGGAVRAVEPATKRRRERPAAAGRCRHGGCAPYAHDLAGLEGGRGLPLPASCEEGERSSHFSPSAADLCRLAVRDAPCAPSLVSPVAGPSEAGLPPPRPPLRLPTAPPFLACPGRAPVSSQEPLPDFCPRPPAIPRRLPTS